MGSMEDFLVPLRVEKARLRAHLETIPEFQLYEHVSRLLAEYERGLPAALPPASPPVETSPPPAPGAPPPAGRPEAGMLAIQEAAAKFLSRRRSRATSPEIHEALIRRGLMEPGERDRRRVTSYLSRDKETFDNTPGEGYGLVKWCSHAPEEDPPEGGEWSSAGRTNSAGAMTL